MWLQSIRDAFRQRADGNNRETAKETMAHTVVEVEMMMIMIKMMNDEGHGDNVSDETDNDNGDFLSIFIFSLALVI